MFVGWKFGYWFGELDQVQQTNMNTEDQTALESKVRGERTHMNRTSASGEQAALRGYRWQYDQIAKLVYDAILDGKLVSVRLTDPNAGQVDDLVLVRTGRTDAYQFKSGSNKSVTFRRITHEPTNRSASNPLTWIQTLANAWRNLRRDSRGQVHVHFCAEAVASSHDRIVDRDNPTRPSPNHFRAFQTRVLEPLRTGAQTLDEIDKCWQTALETLREKSGVSQAEFVPFLQSLHFDLNTQSGLDGARPELQDELITLSAQLERLASEGNGVVELPTEQLLTLMGWQGRTRLRSAHNFPVNSDTYVPLSVAIEQISDLIRSQERGYIAVVGPPGTGKSTLLTQALSNTSDRVIRYYAYVPGADAARTRLTGRSFLHDVVLKLKESGLKGKDRQLTSTDTDQLRQQRAELFDAASQEFDASGCRTLIVVDGLDHVKREYDGNDGLLSELPKVDELPRGVLLVVGTRKLSPLGPDVRQNVQAGNTFVDLSQHPLSPSAIRKICRCTPGVPKLGEEALQYIVERCAGHPLSLSYLLNKLRDEQAEFALAILESTPDYTGDIGATYKAIWDEVECEDTLVRIFAICARLRIDFRTEWLDHILPNVPLRHEIVQRFIRDYQYLFHVSNDEWRFFHDSFRQFAVEHTALGPDGVHSHKAEENVHRIVAKICAQFNDWRLASEELHHQYLGHQHEKVLALASQTTWRCQFQNLRSPSLIQQDIELVLEVAATRTDVFGMLQAILGIVELQSRISVLEDIDLPYALYQGGLVDEAIKWCSGKNPAVLLSYRYNLAWMLGREGNMAARPLFEANEHHGFDEPSGLRISGHENDAALAWTRAAAIFKSISSVIQSIENHLVEQTTTGQRVHLGHEYEAWHRYLLMMRELIDAALDLSDPSGLNAIDQALALRLTNLEANDDPASDTSVEQRRQQIAVIVDLRLRSAIALQAVVQDSEALVQSVASWLADANSLPMFRSTLLDAAELLANSDRPEQVKHLLDRSRHKRAFTADDLLSDRRNDTVGAKFRYWRLRYRLATPDEEVSASIPPEPETPAGDEIPQHAAMHSDLPAIRFAERIDGLVRELARIDAGTLWGAKEFSAHVWLTVLQAIDLVPVDKSRTSMTPWAKSLRAPELLKTAVEVVTNYGDGLPQRLSNELCRRFHEHPIGWVATPLLDVMHVLKSAGADVTWGQKVLRAHEVSVAEEDIYQKIEKAAELIHHYSVAGQIEKAAELARDLPRMAFAIGFRKDHQFNEWIGWYSATIAAPDGIQFLEDGSWLARLLAAAEPMTEGAPGQAAVELPAALAAGDPLAAVRTFEYLVRQGTVLHFPALAALVRGLIEQAGSEDANMVALAADITAHLISAGATRAYPELAAAITTAANRVNNSRSAGEFAESIASLTDRFALSTTRSAWRRGLGLSHNSASNENGDEDDDFYTLILDDGRRIASSNAATQIKTVDDILRFRQMEASESRFPWQKVIQQQNLTSNDISQLAPLFQGSDQRELNVLVTLAKIAEKIGDREIALELATEAFESARGETWASNGGGTKLRSAAIRIRLGGDQLRIDACKDLAHQVGGIPWLGSLLIFDLQEIAAILDSDLTKSLMWPLVREYLNGMAEPLDLGENDPFEDYGCRWWLPTPSTDHREPCKESTPNAALAELIVGHLAHSTWLVSDAAATVVVHALAREDKDVAQALARFARADTSDDLLERAGRCLAAVRERFRIEVPSCLEPLDLALAAHQSHVLRHLASAQPCRVNRALSEAYRLALPTGFADSNDSALSRGFPYEYAYQLLAQDSDLDLTAILRVAAQYTNDELATLPAAEDIVRALETSAVKLHYPSPELFAQRAAFGRVVTDFRDAGMLEGASTEIVRMLRTVDIDLVGRTPKSRPDIIPEPPTAGHDQTIERWIDELDARLQAYIHSSIGTDRWLIGAKTQLAVLNWDHLKEEFQCGTTIGIGEPSEDGVFLSQASMRLSDLTVATECEYVFHGDPLIIQNYAHTFHQIQQADWLAFRPDLATVLGWLPESSCPGRWLTSAGTLAVETIWWTDGWWGREGRAFDDTVARGNLVLITEEGIASIQDTFGTLVRHFRLTRSGKEDSEATGPVISRESIPLQTIATTGSR